MAMFNFELGGEQQVKKPMRSYIDIDESGRPKARIYADEYDIVKSNPDFQPYLTGAGRNMETAQSAFNDEMQEARLQAVEKRIQAKKQEAISAEMAAREAAPGNLYPGLDIYQKFVGGQTFAQRATSRQEELKKLLEERAALEGTPEISAPMTNVSEPTAQEAPVAAPVAPIQQAPAKKTIKVRNPDGKILPVPVEMWNKNPKGYIEQGYQIVP